MNFRDRAVMIIATGFGIGYIPYAPGTFGSLLGLWICYVLADLNIWAVVGWTISLVIVAVWVADAAEEKMAQKDPGSIVIDEIAGMVVTLIGIPFSISTAVAAFILFRIFDIAKPFPIRLIDQKLSGGFGVVMDDILAGIYGNLSLRLLLLIQSRL